MHPCAIALIDPLVPTCFSQSGFRAGVWGRVPTYPCNDLTSDGGEGLRLGRLAVSPHLSPLGGLARLQGRSQVLENGRACHRRRPSHGRPTVFALREGHARASSVPATLTVMSRPLSRTLLREFVHAPCPNCGFLLQVQLVDAHVQAYRRCPCCRLQIRFVEPDGSVSGSMSTVDAAMNQLQRAFDSFNRNASLL